MRPFRPDFAWLPISERFIKCAKVNRKLFYILDKELKNEIFSIPFSI